MPSNDDSYVLADKYITVKVFFIANNDDNDVLAHMYINSMVFFMVFNSDDSDGLADKYVIGRHGFHYFLR